MHERRPAESSAFWTERSIARDGMLLPNDGIFLNGEEKALAQNHLLCPLYQAPLCQRKNMRAMNYLLDAPCGSIFGVQLL